MGGSGIGEPTQKRIFATWAPLALTWLMMSLEGPFLAAVIARRPDPEVNLAAYGVAFAFGMLLESPVILIMSASTALVKDRTSLVRLRTFTYALNAAITAAMGVLLLPPVFHAVTRTLMGLPEAVSSMAWKGTLFLLPWPAAIGYRRFYHGILIGAGRTRRVAYGTTLRLASMAGTALLLCLSSNVPGAVAGTAALAAGVVAEAAASRFWSWGSVREVEAREASAGGQTLGYAQIARFYYPLALTSMLALGVNPLVSGFLGGSRLALESLAVMPVVNSLVFLFGSTGLAFQEVAIALLGPAGEGFASLRRFASRLGVVSAGSLALVAVTPALEVWLRLVSGLSRSLAQVATRPVLILAVMPALSVLISFQRALLVASRNTRPVTWATAFEVGTIAATMAVLTRGLGWVGATAAAAALVAGRLAAVSLLFPKSLGRAGKAMTS
jgi:hypothetical protein